MPTMPQLRDLLRSRRLAVAVAAAVTIGGVAAAASARGGDQKAQAPSGPTAAASVRDLITTLKTTGTVERVDRRTISYAAAQAAPTAGAGDTGPAAGATTGATVPGPAAITPTTSPESTARTTPTTAPSTPTTTTSSTTATTSPAPPTNATTTDPTTTDPATAEPGTTGTESPSTTATTAPAPDGDGSPTTTTTTPAPANADPATTTTTRPTSTTTTTSATTVATSTDSATGSAAEATPTLTGILAVGVKATRGAVLYTADGEPTVALFGTIPLWRTLEVGVDAGADVRQLEENLVTLGYGSGVTVDNTFTAGTANAVKRWEAALGRTDPDGTVELGDVVYLTGAGTVLAHDATAGEPLDTGTPILTVGSDEQVITAKVPAGERAGWTPGMTVNLMWADATTTTGTVSAVSSDVVDEQVEVTVAPAGADADAERPSGAEVTVTAVDVRHDGVVAVPVAAIVAGTEGGRAVRVPAGDGTDRLTPVQTGLVADGWIEITSGLKAGENVRLPG